MKKFENAFKIVAIMVFPLFFNACLSIHVSRNVDNADAYFLRAYKEIERIQRKDPSREREAHRLNILAYDSSSRELVCVSVPLWLVNACLDLGKKASKHDRQGFEFQDRYDVEWEAVKDIGQFGPGLLVEVEDVRDQVLIWLK